MKRKNVADTLYGLRMSLTVEDKKIQLLLGIYESQIDLTSLKKMSGRMERTGRG